MSDAGHDLDRLPFATRDLFESGVVKVGATRCGPEHPDFAEPGPVERHVFMVPGSSVWVQAEDEVAFLADPSLVTLHNAGDVVRRRAQGRRGDHSHWFAVAPSILARAVRAVDPRLGDEGRPFSLRRVPSDPKVALVASWVVDHLWRGGDDPLFVEEAALWLVDRLVERLAERAGGPERGRSARGGAPDARTRARHRDLVHDAQALLLRRFRERASLAGLARELGCSEHHLTRVFRRLTSRPLHRHRHLLRMRAALEALRAYPGCDLTELALDLGFSSHAHFSSSFRRAFGLPPSALRRDGRALWRAWRAADQECESGPGACRPRWRGSSSSSRPEPT